MVSQGSNDFAQTNHGTICKPNYFVICSYKASPRNLKIFFGKFRLSVFLNLPSFFDKVITHMANHFSTHHECSAIFDLSKKTLNHMTQHLHSWCLALKYLHSWCLALKHSTYFTMRWVFASFRLFSRKVLSQHIFYLARLFKQHNF